MVSIALFVALCCSYSVPGRSPVPSRECVDGSNVVIALGSAAAIVGTERLAQKHGAPVDNSPGGEYGSAESAAAPAWTGTAGAGRATGSVDLAGALAGCDLRDHRAEPHARLRDWMKRTEPDPAAR